MTGFVVYHAKRDSFLNWKIYFSEALAQSALERVVWHNRGGWQILPMPAPAAPPAEARVGRDWTAHVEVLRAQADAILATEVHTFEECHAMGRLASLNREVADFLASRSGGTP